VRSARGGAWPLQWRLVHLQMIDRPERTPMVVPFYGLGAQKIVFWSANVAAARGGTWAAHPRTPVARESASWL
jgi:hypothetical protein